jgi:hypothetical protein
MTCRFERTTESRMSGRCSRLRRRGRQGSHGGDNRGGPAAVRPFCQGPAVRKYRPVEWLAKPGDKLSSSNGYMLSPLIAVGSVIGGLLSNHWDTKTTRKQSSLPAIPGQWPDAVSDYELIGVNEAHARSLALRRPAASGDRPKGARPIWDPGIPRRRGGRLTSIITWSASWDPLQEEGRSGDVRAALSLRRLPGRPGQD